MNGRRGIVITADDMASLKELVRHGRTAWRRDQRHVEELAQELEHAQVVAAGEVPPDVVTVHSTVRIRDVDTGARMVYTVVFPHEADVAAGWISVLAPIGTALIGYRVGDVIDWRTPGGARRFRVEAILYQPEAAAAKTGGAAAAASPQAAGAAAA